MSALARKFATSMKSMYAARAITPGSSMVLEVSEHPRPIPGNEEVLIKVHYSAVNRADILQRMGKYPPPPGCTDILGLEAVGEVESTG